MFTEETHSAIVQGIVSSLRQNISLEKGVLNSLELCLNEVSDNVLVHSSKMDESENPYGLMMAQIHKNTQRIVAVVYDNGIGIPSSLRTSGINCIDGNDAIAHAMQKGVTDGNGAGNGLWILDSIVRQNQGSFEITSDGVRYSLRHSQKHSKAEESFSKASSAIPGTTLVDFQLDISNNIDLNEIIGGPGYIDLWAENHEDEANENNMRLKLREEANGFGSRYDAARMRNLVINTANMTEGLVILDFCDVEAVSMSFADELIRKLSDEVGFVSFSNKIRFSGLNSECQSIIDAVMRKNSWLDRTEL